MFEKEAEEYSTSSKVDYVNNIAITLVQQAYKDGAEFGYKKANEWHDLRKNPNDLPKEKTFVISNIGSLVFYKKGKWYEDIPDNAYYFSTDEVVAWCEIPQFKDKE